MKLKVDQVTFNLLLDESRLKNPITPIIFLHGFTGSSEDWSFIFDKLPANYLPVAVDLIGHGKTESPNDIIHYSAVSQIEQLKKIIKILGFSQVILCGYSMGGRLALSFAVKYQELIDRLILESSTPGLKDESERMKRIESDNQIADLIETEGINNFISYWMNIHLFETLKKLPEKKFMKLVESKLTNSSTGLANSLRGFSTG
ncbi:alpha/beta fold hydrolase, partial [Bacteroidota bacterium]